MYSTLKEIKDSNITIINELSYHKSDLEDYIEMFNDYLTQGVFFKGSKFEDEVWRITNQVEHKAIKFKLDEVKFKNQSSKRNLGFRYSELILALKFFTLLLLRNNSIVSTKNYISNIIWLIENTHYFDIDQIKPFRRSIKRNGGMSHIEGVIKIFDFLDYFNNIIVPDKYYFLFEDMQDVNNQPYTRSLPTFESMFKFDELIERFLNEADDTEMEKYFPIILWWKITSLIPLRSTEFILTPYNCIVKNNDIYKMTIRRTIEKGRKSTDYYHHSLEDGYTKHDIVVNEEIFKLITTYKSMVDKYDHIENYYADPRETTGERKFLLSFRSYYNFSEKKTKSLSVYIFDFFSVRQLRHLFHSFFTNIASKKYGYLLIDKVSSTSNNSEKCNKRTFGSDLLPYQMELIQIMDTRHFAIMNMILSDIPPVAVKTLAGHKDITATYHYYNHIESFVQSYTYHLAKKHVKNENNNDIFDMRLHQTPMAKSEYYLPKIESGEIKAKKVDNGWCIYKKDDFIPCKKYNYTCERGCGFYIPTEKGITNISQIVNEENNNQINTSIRIIKELIKDRKIIKNFEERVRTEISKVSSYAEQNSMIIKEHMIKKL